MLSRKEMDINTYNSQTSETFSSVDSGESITNALVKFGVNLYVNGYLTSHI
jgi:hypothetical protein